MVFTNNNVAVYKDGVHQANVTTTYTTAQLFDLQWTQSADTMIIVHEAHAPMKLVRGAHILPGLYQLSLYLMSLNMILDLVQQMFGPMLPAGPRVLLSTRHAYGLVDQQKDHKLYGDLKQMIFLILMMAHHLMMRV